MDTTTDDHGRIILAPREAQLDRLLASEAVTQVVARPRRPEPSLVSRIIEGPFGGVVFFALLGLVLVLFFGGSN